MSAIFKASLILTLIFSTAALLPEEGDKAQVNWPSYRGPNADGYVAQGELPLSWSVPDGESIAWSTKIPGLGHSSPIIWEDRIYLTSAISGKDDPYLKVGLYGNIEPVEDDTEHQWLILALDKASGDILWQKTLHRGVPAIKRHTKATHANSTPVTDGKYLLAFFGSEGLYCMDMDGNLLWKKDFGVLDSGFFMAKDAQWGFASSPRIYQDKVIVQCDVQEGSFVAVLNLETGEEIWRASRNEVPTWCTPTIYEHANGVQVILNGWKHAGAYDLNSGTEIWKITDGGDIPVPTPVLGDGLVYLTSAHGPMSPIYAVRLDAQGDITLKGEETSNTGIAWSIRKGGAYMQTPILVGDLLFSSRDNGVLSCFNAKTGERLYQQRLGRGQGGFTASPVGGDGKLYFTSENGEVYVIAAKDTFEQLALNDLDDIFMSTPAISEGRIYFRTRYSLIAIE